MVRFNDVNEFLENLDKDRDLVDRRIVHVTNLYRASKLTASIQHLSVLATARISGEIVRLEVYCGDLWGITHQDEPVLAKADRVKGDLMEGAGSLDLDIRAGMIVDGADAT